MTTGKTNPATIEALVILNNASKFQLGDAMRVCAAGLSVQREVGFDAEEEIMAHGVLNDALRYLETGVTSGLRYGAYFMADYWSVAPVRERAL